MATINNNSTNAAGARAPARTVVAPSKNPLPTAKTVDTQSVLKRYEWRYWNISFPLRKTIYSTGKEQLLAAKTQYWKGRNTSYHFHFKPPGVKFEMRCFHPNFDMHGNICLDILQDKWSSAYDVRTILLSIQSLLGELNTSSPLNTQAASLWGNQEGWIIWVLR
ncbi:Hypothetical predicted protein [Olea europaea subsp. europaea]|uniref:UBC core domain-containing protein n=1 Tax=Olea europaea subsp. europaea TaxID=158383 RepID=A0A8S0UUG7_OLEEU|nr:Hypothetical predicted protein [Olea europaea subsp. europaea]